MAKKNSKTAKKKVVEKNKKIDKLSNEMVDKICVVLGVVIFLCLFFLLTLYITIKNSDEKKDKKEETTETTFSYENIMIGRSLSMGNDDYLVIFYDKKDEETSNVYGSLVSTYKGKEEHMDMYTVDMSNSFNKTYATKEESNKNPSSVEEMAINGPTLMKISNGEVVEYIEGEEDITNYLK